MQHFPNSIPTFFEIAFSSFSPAMVAVCAAAHTRGVGSRRRRRGKPRDGGLSSSAGVEGAGMKGANGGGGDGQ